MLDLNHSAGSHLQPELLSNLSYHDGCTEHDIIFTDMKHSPSGGGGHHGEAGTELQMISRKVKDALLIILFLIGGPANVINMAVFFKQGLKDRVNLCLFTLSLTDVVHLIMAMVHHGEQLHLQFTTKANYGPVDTFLTNHNLLGLMGFNYISYILSAIVACERCFCVLKPLKFQTLLRTRTMAVIIVVSYCLVLGLFFICATRSRLGCVYDPVCKAVVKTPIDGEFYKEHKDFVDKLESIVFGVGIPAVVTIAVIITTKLTISKLREIVTWRSETSSSSSSSLSPREVALSKMLVGNSILFLVCIFPVAVFRFSWLFVPGLKDPNQNLNFFATSRWISEVFTFINASLNIFVYYAMGSRYRETFWALFGRKIQLEKPEPEAKP